MDVPWNLVLSERSQKHIVLFHLYEMSRIGESIEIGSRFVLGRGWDSGEHKCLWVLSFFWEVQMTKTKQFSNELDVIYSRKQSMD